MQGSGAEVDPSQTSLSSDHVQRALSVVQSLKAQHSALLKSLQTSLPTPSFPDFSLKASLPGTAEEEEHTENFELTPRHSTHESISTTITESVNEWFDALDVAEEFVMDIPAALEGNDMPIQTSPDENRSVVNQQEDSSIDTDIDEADNVFTTSRKTRATSQGIITILRRTHLPAPSIGDEGSLFAMLKKNIGKVFSICILWGVP